MLGKKVEVIQCQCQGWCILIKTWLSQHLTQAYPGIFLDFFEFWINFLVYFYWFFKKKNIGIDPPPYWICPCLDSPNP